MVPSEELERYREALECLNRWAANPQDTTQGLLVIRALLPVAASAPCSVETAVASVLSYGEAARGELEHRERKRRAAIAVCSVMDAVSRISGPETP